LSRLRSGTKTVHLAEILASTDAPAPDRASGAGAGVPAPGEQEITSSRRTPAATGGSPA
jgi:hypothetical protein